MPHLEAANLHAVVCLALYRHPPCFFRPEVIEVPRVRGPHFDAMPRPRQPLGKLLKIKLRAADVGVVALDNVEYSHGNCLLLIAYYLLLARDHNEIKRAAKRAAQMISNK